MTLPQSPYFTLEQLADGVFAAIGIPGSPVYSNAGIIDAGDLTLIVDTFNTPLAAEDLEAAANTLTGHPARFVVNTHAHSDHWMGNQVFTEAAILTTPQNLPPMTELLDEIKDTRRHPGEFQTYLEDVEKRLYNCHDVRLREHLAWTLTSLRHELVHLRELKPIIPNQTFTGRLTLHGTQRKLDIHTPGAGHSSSDVIVSLPDDGIAFIGDLGFFQTHPYLGDSQPAQWIATLDKLAELDLKAYVPGHGPIGTQADLLAIKEYILTLDALVTTVIEAGGSEDQAANQPMPTFAAEWAGYGRFESSLRFLYQQKRAPQA
jgi:cyclase